LLALLGGLTSLTLFFILKHQPTFYRSATMPEGEDRRGLSREFESRWTSLGNSIYNQYPDWWEVFTADQINAFLQEGFIQSWGGDNNLPDGFHDMRVQIEEGKLRLGCRYGAGFWSSVLSIDVKMWLVAREVNLIGVEILSLRAGALPISRQFVLDYITEAARRSNIEVTWFHREGNPVAILKLQADQTRPTIQLQRFELQQGKIVVVGRSTDPHVSHSTGKPTAP
jgi:hypothetical protein